VIIQSRLFNVKWTRKSFSILVSNIYRRIRKRFSFAPLVSLNIIYCSSTSMASLPTLPEECLQEIILETPFNSLPALALTCRTLYRSTIPHRYRFVYFWEPGYRGYTFPLTQCSEWLRAARGGTRIFNLEKFIRTIHE
jgi:hypothetical protein